jgi:transposase
VIKAPKLEEFCIVRYELSDFEWAAIKPLLPNKSRGVRRVNDRRVLNGIFWVLCSGAPWRDLPVCYGPRTTCYNRFVRWRRAGVWGRIMDTLAAAHDARAARGAPTAAKARRFVLDPVPERPYGMKRRTYCQLCMRIERLERPLIGSRLARRGPILFTPLSY